MEVLCCNKNDKEHQMRLNRLLKEVYLDFECWYDLDLWDENYESYFIMEGEKVISNICVYKMKITFNEKEKLALSIGSVATQKEYRSKGLSSKIMNHILEKYKEIPIYLCANESVEDFYPKFGFSRAYEKVPTTLVNLDNKFKPIRLRCDDPKVKNYVYNRINYSKKFDCLNSAAINLLHIYLGYLKNDMYDLVDIDTMLIASRHNEILRITAIFSLREITFSDLVKNIPFSGIEKIEFGFTPNFKDLDYIMEEEVGSIWFLKNVECDLSDVKFPELSTT